MLEVIAAIALIAGAVVILIGAIGLVRFPDFYTRIHAVGVVDTLGAGLVLLGLLLLSPSIYVFFKVLMIGGLLFILAPVASHGLAKTALQTGLKPETGSTPDND